MCPPPVLKQKPSEELKIYEKKGQFETILLGLTSGSIKVDETQAAKHKEFFEHMDKAKNTTFLENNLQFLPKKSKDEVYTALTRIKSGDAKPSDYSIAVTALAYLYATHVNFDEIYAKYKIKIDRAFNLVNEIGRTKKPSYRSPEMYAILKRREIERDGTKTGFEITREKMESWCPPVMGSKIPSAGCLFGASRNEYTTTSGAVVKAHLHRGIDIFAEAGKPVLAAIKGEIFGLIETHGSGGYKVITRTIVDGTEYFVEYMHLLEGSFKHLKTGQIIESGTELASVGNTGMREGGKPHLHISIKKRINKDEYIRLRKIKAKYLGVAWFPSYEGRLITAAELKTLDSEERKKVTKAAVYFEYINPIRYIQNGNDEYMDKNRGKAAINIPIQNIASSAIGTQP